MDRSWSWRLFLDTYNFTIFSISLGKHIANSFKGTNIAHKSWYEWHFPAFLLLTKMNVPGPTTWPSVYPTCSGIRQSPINIQTSRVHFRNMKASSMISFLPQMVKLAVIYDGATGQNSQSWSNKHSMHLLLSLRFCRCRTKHKCNDDGAGDRDDDSVTNIWKKTNQTALKITTEDLTTTWWWWLWLRWLWWWWLWWWWWW